MAKMSFVCLYLSYLEQLAPYSHGEIGNLAMAMLEYAKHGNLPNFEGNEKYIWPTLKEQIDRDAASYQEKCMRNKENGKKGGRPPKNQTVIPKTEGFSHEPKKAKEKENENSTFPFSQTAAPGLEAGEQVWDPERDGGCNE